MTTSDGPFWDDQHRPLGFCMYDGKLTGNRMYAQGIRMPFCDFGCREKWSKMERAERRGGRPRRRKRTA